MTRTEKLFSQPEDQRTEDYITGGLGDAGADLIASSPF